MTQKRRPHRGFKFGEGEWQEFLQAPISNYASVNIAVTGEVTREGIDRCIEYLELIREGFLNASEQPKGKEME